MLEHITPVILTYNEAPNIARSLQKLAWASRIVVIDSYSSDETLKILATHPQVETFQREFDTHTNQWNYGLAQVKTDWVISLDADYVLSDELIDEMKQLSPTSEEIAYFIGFKYCVFGKPLRGSILPPRQMLFRQDCATYIDDGHTQLLSVTGKSDTLNSSVFHDDRKSLSRWVWAQERYMIIESQKLLSTPNESLSFGDRLRKQKIIAPFAVLFYCLVIKGGMFDGWRGWYYSLQRLFAETLLSLRLMEDSKQ